MSQYSKGQEDRMERKFLSNGWRLVEDTSRRKKHKGDRIFDHTIALLSLTVDHKSTIGREQITIKRADLEKIAKEAAPGTLPALTFSYKGQHKVYVIFDIDDLNVLIME